MIFSGVSTVVLFLLIGGTSYDLYLSKRVAHKQNMSYDLEKHVKLEQLANGNGKMHNGKVIPRFSSSAPHTYEQKKTPLYLSHTYTYTHTKLTTARKVLRNKLSYLLYTTATILLLLLRLSVCTKRSMYTTSYIHTPIFYMSITILQTINNIIHTAAM